jgi:predicted kinase
MRDPVLDNLRLLAPDAGRLFPRAIFERVERAAREFLATHADAFEARRRAGRAVDGHGDVHLAHVWFEPGRSEPTLVDCIEFNPKLRRIDAAAEVAFLAMDLAYRGRARLAERFLATYAEAADDTDLYTVVDYFVSYRAAVRAKVAALAAHDAAIDAAQRRNAATSARRHLDFAARALAPRPPGGLVLVGGTVGSGKSSAAREIADALDAVLLSSDALRKRLAGLPATDRSAASRGLYAADARRAVYRALCDRAAPVLRAGRVAVLDATWSKRADRRRAVALAKRCGVPLWIVETRVPRRVALDRLARRAAAGTSASDAGPERLAASEAEFARPLAPSGVGGHVVRTDRAGWRAGVRRAARVWRRRGAP